MMVTRALAAGPRHPHARTSVPPACGIYMLLGARRRFTRDQRPLTTDLHEAHRQQKPCQHGHAD